MKKLLFLIPLALIAEDTKVVSPAQPLTRVEKLALEQINTRQRDLSEDIRAFSQDLCGAHKIPIAECSIDPQNFTVSQVEKPKETSKPAETKK